jgi:hypothetical protein
MRGVELTHQTNLCAMKIALPENALVTTTVYSMLWPETRALVRRCMTQEADQMLARHDHAHTKRQDAMHEAFFDAWLSFAATGVNFPASSFPERYPTAGSSEAIREIIRQAGWKQQDLVVFDGEYEGYEAIAAAQGTRIHRVCRARWQEQLREWMNTGAPWGHGGAQWWISQPSAIDGNQWNEFATWLESLGVWFPDCQVWVDLTYVGAARQSSVIDLSHAPNVAGVVFSLSKVMGAYYRRIGGCFARDPVEGLWANRWFKNLDSLYLGQRWCEQSKDARTLGASRFQLQCRALETVLSSLGDGGWSEAGILWQPSDVALLIHARNPTLSAPDALFPFWEASRRGSNEAVSRRLCLTPILTKMLEDGYVAS